MALYIDHGFMKMHLKALIDKWGFEQVKALVDESADHAAAMVKAFDAIEREGTLERHHLALVPLAAVDDT